MKNTDKNDTMQPVEFWIENHVFELLKNHSDKFPYYHANIKVLGKDDEKQLVRVSIEINGKGRNETQQNLCLFLIDSLKSKKHDTKQTHQNISN